MNDVYEANVSSAKTGLEDWLRYGSPVRLDSGDLSNLVQAELECSVKQTEERTHPSLRTVHHLR